jgi:hypothetical protein
MSLYKRSTVIGLERFFAGQTLGPATRAVLKNAPVEFLPGKRLRMKTLKCFLAFLTLVLLPPPASAGTVYVVNIMQQFGTVDLTSGAFTPIGPGTPEGEDGLVPGPNGSLLTLTYSGNLDSINPATGLTTVIGATGLGNCTTGVPPQCGPNSASTLGELGGKVFATDYANNLYSINTVTGQDALIGATGIPAVPFLPHSQNPDGSINVFDADLFTVGAQLYEIFEALAINPFGPLPVVVNEVIPPELYRLNTTTGLATLIGSTAVTLNSVVNVNGTIYGFDGSLGDLVTLNPTNGNITIGSTLDPNAGIILGASPTPEPGSILLTALGIAALGIGVNFRRAARRTHFTFFSPRGRSF